MQHALPSPLELFLAADPVVKGVMLGLVLASLACWTIIIEKLATIRRLRREAKALALAEAGQSGAAGLAGAVLGAALPEWRRGQGARETDGEYRQRLEVALRRPVAAAMKRAESGLPILATTGSVGPFVGLFGTVWGIMNSFAGIAASQDTSLAGVAPGIAEALFATAIGLVAAIPAVIAYNRFAVALAAVRQEAMIAASDLALRLSRAAPVGV
ncbi:MotA/TolQ/ExbB proton channel family protein [Siccirubricoccus sp. KC 17139]|uniref:MotA/TolQ/ExbB proton channel family protein n=1 Tax=Siccirubricoccus soli TaxID=2899147 RepID=A0ABT1DCI2_9PROT|nr:MotA/TolQ/ExbB proton channel family protein [Siccirubricoccus soli]MCO6419647.1 MotA/TolQ/ExbB proton channel family protein [Siccirubricoccus soli]MCP2685782.1 MotA/TolQ/ExbB proton channel family protein [Siccirubricoccus soli]